MAASKTTGRKAASGTKAAGKAGKKTTPKRSAARSTKGIVSTAKDAVVEAVGAIAAGAIAGAALAGTKLVEEKTGSVKKSVNGKPDSKKGKAGRKAAAAK